MEWIWNEYKSWLCCTKNNNELSFAIKRILFLHWQKQNKFNTTFMRVFDSFFFIKGLLVWIRYSYAESQWTSKNTTIPPLHSCPYQAFSEIQFWKLESKRRSHIWSWLIFPVKHISSSHNLQILRFRSSGQVFGFLAFSSVWACMRLQHCAN